MVLKPGGDLPGHRRFENDVKMYGTQTFPRPFNSCKRFENDVKMYGTQTPACLFKALAVV